MGQRDLLASISRALLKISEFFFNGNFWLNVWFKLNQMKEKRFFRPLKVANNLNYMVECHVRPSFYKNSEVFYLLEKEISPQMQE